MARIPGRQAQHSVPLTACLLLLATALPVPAGADPPTGAARTPTGAEPLALSLPAELRVLGIDIKVSTKLPLAASVPPPATASPLEALLPGARASNGVSHRAPATATTPVRQPRRRDSLRLSRPSRPGGQTTRASFTTGSHAASAPGDPGGRRVASSSPGSPVATARLRRTPPPPRMGIGSADYAASGPLAGLRRRVFPRAVPDWSHPLVLGLLLIALGLGVRSLVAGARARRLERQRRLLIDDVGLLQRALVPSVPGRLADLAISAAYRPAEGPGAGGDFYDVFPLADRRVGVILGDVSGHGRDALERATLVRYTVRAYVETGLEPRAALQLAGSVLAGDDEDWFATVAVAIFDSNEGVLTYALAGHPPPLLLGAGVPEPLSVCSSPPVGLGLPTGLRQTKLSLSPGAVTCFFTDGLVEARVGETMLGRENLERLLVLLGPEPDAAALLSQAAEHASDDMAVCMVRVAVAPRREPLQIEELEVAPCDLGGTEPARFLSACGVAPDEIAPALETAGATSDVNGVVIRVQRAERNVSVEVHTLAPESFRQTLVGAHGSRSPLA